MINFNPFKRQKEAPAEPPPQQPEPPDPELIEALESSIKILEAADADEKALVLDKHLHDTILEPFWAQVRAIFTYYGVDIEGVDIETLVGVWEKCRLRETHTNYGMMLKTYLLAAASNYVTENTVFTEPLLDEFKKLSSWESFVIPNMPFEPIGMTVAQVFNNLTWASGEFLNTLFWVNLNREYEKGLTRETIEKIGLAVFGADWNDLFRFNYELLRLEAIK